MSMSEFLIMLDQKLNNVIPYIQRQNSNLTQDFPEIIDDVGEDIKWASEAFNKSPDAVNFWMGDERAITSSNHVSLFNIYLPKIDLF